MKVGAGRLVLLTQNFPTLISIVPQCFPRITYDDFEAYGIHRHAISPAIREAEALGFLQVTERGRAGNAEFRSPNRFRLTYRHAKDVLGDGTHAGSPASMSASSGDATISPGDTVNAAWPLSM